LKTRYKIGKFDHALAVGNGDTLRLTVTDDKGVRQTVSEDITITMTVTHWVMLYIPGVGFGGLFGGPELGEKMSEIFVNPELVDIGETLIGE
jgi:hypothetical protein